MTEEAKRAKFEEVLYKDFFIRSITKVGDGPFPFETTNVTKAELCARDAKGNYVREDISAMWFGYCLHEDT